MGGRELSVNAKAVRQAAE
jgi:chromosome segregation ATPase